jgi:hypothetical protein
LTARDFTAGASRSIQSLSAVVSPAMARSTHLRVKASASPSRSSCTAMVALCRAPLGLPAGLPDIPFRNGRPRCFPGVFSASVMGYCAAIGSSVAMPSRAVARLAKRVLSGQVGSGRVSIALRAFRALCSPKSIRAFHHLSVSDAVELADHFRVSLRSRGDSRGSAGFGQSSLPLE